MFKNTFFTEHLWWLLLAMGVPYLVKLRVTFFIKKIESHSPEIFAAILKKLYFKGRNFKGRNFRVSKKTRNLWNKLSPFAVFGTNFVGKSLFSREKTFANEQKE